MAPSLTLTPSGRLENSMVTGSSNFSRLILTVTFSVLPCLIVVVPGTVSSRTLSPSPVTRVVLSLQPVTTRRAAAVNAIHLIAYLHCSRLSYSLGEMHLLVTYFTHVLSIPSKRRTKPAIRHFFPP